MSKICLWIWDDDGFYSTECGQTFWFNTGDIKENKFKFCPYCGGKIKEAK